MNLINTYQKYLVLIPILIGIPFAYFGGWIPNTSAFTRGLNHVLDILTEKDLEKLSRRNGYSKWNALQFQTYRLGISLVIPVIVFAMFFIFYPELLISDIKKTAFVFILAVIVIFKGIYLILEYKEKQRIARMNTLLPYAIRTIAQLIYIYTPVNAIERAIPSIPKEFKDDFEILLRDIYKDTTSYQPYQNMIDRYNGKLKNLDNYFNTIYRLSISGAGEAAELMSNLNKMLADGISVARTARNNAINNRLSYLSMIPVIMLVIALLYLLMIYIDNMNFIM